MKTKLIRFIKAVWGLFGKKR